jgi:hypothetical protein
LAGVEIPATSPAIDVGRRGRAEARHDPSSGSMNEPDYQRHDMRPRAPRRPPYRFDTEQRSTAIRDRYRACLDAIAATPDRRDPLDRRSRARSLWTRLAVSPVDVFDRLGTVAPMSIEGSPRHTG